MRTPFFAWSDPLATFPTTDKAQTRRCRLAQLHGRFVSEVFEAGEVTGYIHSIRMDLLASPPCWFLVISPKAAKRARPENGARFVQTLVLTMVDENATT